MKDSEQNTKKRCEILIQAAIPEIYKLNAFRISGLNIYASTRDISNQVKKNQMMEKYCDYTRNSDSPFPIEPQPDNEQIKDALHRLRNPETRLLDEFFWFWPHNIESANSDEALNKLSQNDINSAEKIWINQEAGLTESNVSKHNLAVLSHLQALDFELNGKEVTKDLLENRDNNWVNSFKRWKQLIDHEGFWNRLTERVRQMDDPRLTTGFVKRLRDTLPTAILQINAQLALYAAENGNEEDAKRQLELLYGSHFSNDDKLSALKRVVEPLRNKIKITCKKYANEKYPEPIDSLNAGKKIIEQTAPTLKVLDILLPEDSVIKEGAHDDVALEALFLLIEYGNNTVGADHTDLLKLYQIIEDISLGESAKARIKQNHEVVRFNHEYRQTHHFCFFCKTNEQDEEVAVSHSMHGEVNRTYNNITWKYLTIKVPRCKQCRHEHNKQDTIITIGVILSIVAGIITGIMMNNIFYSELWWFGILIGVLGIIASSIIGVESRNTRSFGSFRQFPQIQELYKKGWADGERPATG